MKKWMVALAFLGVTLGSVQAEPVRVLVYGDSNTYGWQSAQDDQELPRFGDAVRWPGVMKAALGRDYQVSVNGLPGRTLDTDFPKGIGTLDALDLNGKRRLPLAMHVEGPVNVLVLSLGTNDLIDHFHKSNTDIAASLKSVLELAKQDLVPHVAWKAPRILVIAPAPIGDTSKTDFRDDFGAHAAAQSPQLGSLMCKVAIEQGAACLNAGDVIKVDGLDGLHYSPATHARLGRAVAKKIRQLASTPAH
ncbi:hypothetical protein KSF73_06585 [Burkholderiaceae bacterium DAT-1]|nr:hypothetical protein [Burkholderiaceae bacterium DAT-1]